MDELEKECQKKCDEACVVFAGSLLNIVAIYGFSMVERCLKRSHNDAEYKGIEVDEDFFCAVAERRVTNHE